MNTLFDKIWDAHVVTTVEDGPTQLYIDRLYCHEVTSPQAFAGLRERGIKVLRPEKVFCMPDHNTPTHDQDKPIEDPISKTQVDTLTKNAKDFGLTHFGMMHPKNGIIHVVGPERALTLPGMTIVCGDSHTSTHGAMGAIAFGIGTSEVEMVLASQCILQSRPKTMRITVDGELGKGVTAKDIALYMMSKMTTSGATGYFVEYAGSAIRNLTMEGRLTLCNLSIEMGARGGMVAPDEVTFEYIKGREFSVGVVDGIAYPIIEIAPIEGFYDYTNKYKAGSTVETCPAVLTKEQTEQMQAYAVKGFKALQLDNYGRLDFMMSKDGKMYCLEANTLPGMTPTSLLPQEAQALGMDFADLCEKLIAVSAK